MNYINLKARAKINISLDVTGKFDDGYHNLRMIMQTVNLYDDIYIKKTTTGKTVLKCNISRMPTDDKNLVYRASELLRERYGIKDGIFIQLEKNIPVSAGLAGGSSDCSATLIGIRKLFGLDISDKELAEIGLELGADVPYCLMRGTALAEGKGEILTKLPPFPNVFVVLSKPPVGVSTASVFSKVRLNEIKKHPDTEQLIKHIKNKNLSKICENMYNVLEEVTAPDYPIIDEIKQTMLEIGCDGAMMSGSGPTVFGLFRNKETAYKAYKVLKNEKGIKETYLTKIFNLRY